ncbi:PLEC protein, partial [Podargus strigoides]|nr:PLEC protein [Podargus strigoides]
RLERLQRVVSKLQVESALCEEQLNQADALLQAVRERPLPPRAPACPPPVPARPSPPCPPMPLSPPVPTLCPRRVYRLHERLVAIRTEYNLRLKSGVPATVSAVPGVPVEGAAPRGEQEDPPLRYLQELLGWVEENQRRLGVAEWGGDVPTLDAQLGAHRALHRAITDFRAKIERARADEVGPQRAPGPPSSQGCVGGCRCCPSLRPQSSSQSRLRHLESLHGFVTAATAELLWLSQREEEEVTFDWSHLNPNMAAKKESYS